MGPPDGPAVSSAQIARDQNWGRLAVPFLGPPLVKNCPLERGFNDHQCSSKTRSSSCKTTLMATVVQAIIVMHIAVKAQL